MKQLISSYHVAAKNLKCKQNIYKSTHSNQNVYNNYYRRCLSKVSETICNFLTGLIISLVSCGADFEDEIMCMSCAVYGTFNSEGSVRIVTILFEAVHPVQCFI